MEIINATSKNIIIENTLYETVSYVNNYYSNVYYVILVRNQYVIIFDNYQKMINHINNIQNIYELVTLVLEDDSSIQLNNLFDLCLDMNNLSL